MRTAAERADIRKRYLLVDAANVADVLDELGYPDQGLSPELARRTGSRLAGWAYTISGEMAPYVGTGDELKMRACHGIGPDEVSVWSGGGSGVCYFGELIAVGMMQRGSVGALVDGGIRDSRWLDGLGFDVFARYRSAVQSIGRWKVTGWQAPVYLPGATSRRVVVCPGDFILGDEDGAIAVPEAIAETVLEKAEEMTAKEVAIREALKSGLSLADVLAQFGHV
jgi:4-hydroxy-4-methyl-2-oxoglutarate aldolase